MCPDSAEHLHVLPLSLPGTSAIGRTLYSASFGRKRNRYAPLQAKSLYSKLHGPPKVFIFGYMRIRKYKIHCRSQSLVCPCLQPPGVVSRLLSRWPHPLIISHGGVAGQAPGRPSQAWGFGQRGLGCSAPGGGAAPRCP